MADIFATPGVHAEKFDQVTGGVIPYVTITTPATALPTTDSLGGTRAYNWGTNVRIASASTSSTATPLPTLGTSREIMAHASERCFVRFGDSAVTAAAAGNGQLILEAGERFHLRLAAGVTHFRAIRDTADGFVSITAVV